MSRASAALSEAALAASASQRLWLGAALRRRRWPPAGPPPARRAAAGAAGEQLPPALRDLQISDCGQHLIDSKTGKVINEFGATRFDVAVRAIRGEFDPPPAAANTERESGLLLGCLTRFPTTYDFQLVVRTPQLARAGGSGGSAGAAASGGVAGAGAGADSGATSASSSSEAQGLLERYRRRVADALGAEVPAAACSARPRLGGRYLSLTIPATVPAAAAVPAVLAALDGDPDVVMKY
eukprot:scaffold2.g7077.t1